MIYTDFRDQIKTGDILAWTHRFRWTWYDLQVTAVRIFTMSEYTHVGIAVVMDGRVWVLESVRPLVRLVPLSGELPCYHLPGNGMTEEQRVTAFALVGKGQYSRLEAVMSFFGKAKANSTWSCAEFVCHVLGIKATPTPTEVVQAMLDSGATLRFLK